MTLLIFMIQVGIADNTGTIEPANENDWPIVAVTTGQRYLIGDLLIFKIEISQFQKNCIQISQVL